MHHFSSRVFSTSHQMSPKSALNMVIFTFLQLRTPEPLQKINHLRMPSVLIDPCSDKAPRIVPMLIFLLFSFLSLGPNLVSPAFSSYYLMKFMGSKIRNFNSSNLLCCSSFVSLQKHPARLHNALTYRG